MNIVAIVIIITSTIVLLSVIIVLSPGCISKKPKKSSTADVEDLQFKSTNRKNIDDFSRSELINPDSVMGSPGLNPNSGFSTPRDESMNPINDDSQGFNRPHRNPKPPKEDEKTRNRRIVEELVKKHQVFHRETFPLWTDEVFQRAQSSLLEVEPFTDPWKSPIPSSDDFQTGKWLRPAEIVDATDNELKIFAKTRYSDVHQSSVSDCSFCCSLSLLALHLERTGINYLKHLIYPQDENNEPVFNPSGHYFVKFYFNGGWRAVEVDDLFPVYEWSASKELTKEKPKSLLVAYSMDRTEFWVSIIEKAYTKMRGSGYNFSGSRSSLDLTFLANWIPGTTWKIKDEPKLADSYWNTLLEGYKSNTCLATISTADEKGKSQKTGPNGLAYNHAYAIVDVLVLSNGKKLLKIKNPWAHDRWNGAFSPTDKAVWTEELQKELNYDVTAALAEDDGIFFISFDDAKKCFDNCYVSFSPQSVPHKQTFPIVWPAAIQSKEQSLTAFQGPQFLVFKQKKQKFWFILEQFVMEGDLPVPKDSNDFPDFSELTFGLVLNAHQPTIVNNQDPITNRPQHPRAWHYNALGNISVTQGHIQAVHVTNEFEGYITVLPYIRRDELRDCEFLLHICSSDPVLAENVKPGLAKSDAFLVDKWEPTPLMYETAIYAAPFINLSARPDRPKSQFVTYLSSPTSTRPAMDKILPPSLIPFFHATSSFFSSQYCVSLLPNNPGAPRKKPLVEEVVNGMYFDSDFDKLRLVFQSDPNTPMAVQHGTYSPEPARWEHNQRSTNNPRGSWQFTGDPYKEYALRFFPVTLTLSPRIDILLLISPTLDHPNYFGSYKMSICAPNDYTVKIERLKEEWKTFPYTLFLHGCVNKDYPFHAGIRITQTTEIAWQYIFISDSRDSIAPTTRIYKRDVDPESPTLESVVEQTKTPWPNYTIYFEPDYCGNSRTVQVPSSFQGTQELPFGNMKNTKEMKASSPCGGGNLEPGEYMLRTTVTPEYPVYFVCFMWSDKPLTVFQKQ
ncbi:putative Calpain-type cysteine protease DEK1 [Blattamonas nauphoetae]|uniref:Calpain-type cysteine protease DEK1 n=1 Tax=Blattamonas nauphoetae TaxID=2049346 RepID=A0ABQ9XNW5_9EUKA|nr:putative Calpain-type cysteine protease DEK1 [Blattamonas nauphoetae]